MGHDIGSKIRYFRELRGLSQKEFASKIGVSISRASHWEHDVHRLDADLLTAICLTLQVSADTLLDIRLSDDDLSDCEKQLILQYRARPDLHQSIRDLFQVSNKPLQIPTFTQMEIIKCSEPDITVDEL